MSDDDDLRVRLSRLDPGAGPSPSRPAPDLMELIMSTPVIDTSVKDEQPRGRRTNWLVAAAAALVLAGGGLGLALAQDDAIPAKKAPTTVALKLPPSGVMASCVPFDVTFLKDMSPAFAGTVTEVGATSVTLDVDKWYAGGTADQVTIAQPEGNTSAALDGVAFEKGKRYLVTAANGTVNGCGYSGLATPDFEKSFEQAFPK